PSSTKSWGNVNLINASNEGQILTEIPRLLKKISAQSDLIISKSDIAQKEVLNKAPRLLKLEIDLEVETIPRAEKLQKFLYLLENNEDFTCYIKELQLKELASNEGVNLSAILETFALINR
ncbi:MAG: hypothetical protein ACE5KK_01505, partial [Candidatus Brocadiales bacterium]